LKKFRWIIGGLVAIVALAVVFRGPISMALMRRFAARVMSADPIAELADGIHVVLCGAGSPLPDPARSGPCVGIVAGGELFVVDVGSGASRNMQRMGLPPDQLAAVFLTHFHSDHIDGLGELSLQRWIGGTYTTPLPLIGPSGVDEIAAGFRRAYETDSSYRIAHHGEAVAPPGGRGFDPRAFLPPKPDTDLVVWNQNGLVVTAFRVDHDPVDPAVGYRFDYGGRSVVISGDTTKSPVIERMARGSDLLVHEALAPHLVDILTQAAEQNGRSARAKITRDILDYHASPVEAAQTAEASGVGHLLYYHIVPPLLVPGMEAAFVDGVSEAYSGDFTVGTDGTRVSLPSGSDAIEVSGG
jgi:ribonuclease Z